MGKTHALHGGAKGNLPSSRWVKHTPCTVEGNLPSSRWVKHTPCTVEGNLPSSRWVKHTPCTVEGNLPSSRWVKHTPCTVEGNLPSSRWVKHTPCTVEGNLPSSRWVKHTQLSTLQKHHQRKLQHTFFSYFVVSPCMPCRGVTAARNFSSKSSYGQHICDHVPVLFHQYSLSFCGSKVN